MLILGCHLLNTVMLLVWQLDDITFVAADCTELTCAFMTLIIFLEHLSFTTKVGAFNH